MTDDMKVNEYLEHIKTRKSTAAYYLYKKGLELFFEWLKKDPSATVKDAQKRSTMENFNERNYYGFKIEEWYKALRQQGYAHNSFLFDSSFSLTRPWARFNIHSIASTKASHILPCIPTLFYRF